MRKCAVVLMLAWLVLLSGCSGDVQMEDGKLSITDPEREARAAATRQAAAIIADKESVQVEIQRKSALAEIKLKETQAESEAYKTRVLAEAEAEARRETLIEQGRAVAQVMRAFADAMRIILVLGAVALVIFVTGRSVAGAHNAMLAARYVKIGADPATLQPPPIVITTDGLLLDTRTGERAKLRDAVGVNQLLLAAVTRNLDMAMLARAAEQIARSNSKPGSGGAQVGDILPALASSVPTLVDVEHNGAEHRGTEPATSSPSKAG